MEHNSVPIEAEATHLPESIEVDVEGLTAGTQILAKELKLPAGSTLSLDEDALIVNISAAQTAEELEADIAEAEADLGVEHDQPEAEAEAAAEAEPGEGAEGSTEE